MPLGKICLAIRILDSFAILITFKNVYFFRCLFVLVFELLRPIASGRAWTKSTIMIFLVEFFILFVQSGSFLLTPSKYFPRFQCIVFFSSSFVKTHTYRARMKCQFIWKFIETKSTTQALALASSERLKIEQWSAHIKCSIFYERFALLHRVVWVFFSSLLMWIAMG